MPRGPVLDRLARGAATGEPERVGELLAAVGPLLVRYCRARLGRRGDSYRLADEVAAEAGRAVLTAVPGYTGGPFLRLLYRVLVRTVDDLAPGGKPDVADDLVGLLPVLPPLDRDIMLLRVATGLSATDTALVLGLTTGQVRVAQHRALTRLRALL
ncbi:MULTISPECIES: sigma factor-like helix-turn-helix DNA-binding protein [Amycolatopsis]|uniref:RNA polymerase sigma-70 factor, ECF subfamily n=2 Tax=Amycolatopsis TaxID=1813 RepID=A0A1I3VSX4_9PSEU|nr:sigma factor-like helix-turn-helix DNA-binding protein [Amycolatopsis sacchari]SFJ98260.1 RNA polymerase sigma-70 factor, ECF subfamily [Amycolatopsis sacchari]